MKPVCVPCQRFYRPEKNGFYFTEGMPKGETRRAPPGKDHPELWKPYKLWVGDLWKCHGCEHTIIVGVGGRALSEHYMPDFEAEREKTGGNKFQVNDC